MPLVEEKHVLDTMREAGQLVRTVSLGLESQGDHTPHIVLGHDVYPGVEAHLFTIADSALWLPGFIQSGDVVIYRPRELDEGSSGSALKGVKSDAWRRLLAAFAQFADLLTSYTVWVNQGSIPKTVWAHHEAQWHLGLRDAPDHEPEPVDAFIDYVDESIRSYIRDINELGFATKESCSGILDDHPDREPYRPYVMFDDRVYIDVSAHLFTLADIARWLPSDGPHGFDVMIQQSIGDDIPAAWNRLVTATRTLSPMLKRYRNLIKEKDTLFRRMRERREAPESIM